VRANADGGFDILDAGSTTPSGRMFGYRAGNGDLLLVLIEDDGRVLFPDAEAQQRAADGRRPRPPPGTRR
jgi:hypothetical protein